MITFAAGGRSRDLVIPGQDTGAAQDKHRAIGRSGTLAGPGTGIMLAFR
jgi:hypothetical protein